MIGAVVALALALVDPRTAELAGGVRALAPSYVTDAAALEHAVAAVAAARIYRVDPALLLSIAHHESRFTVDAVTAEVGGRVSCGVMTPVPQARCDRQSLYESYLAGASHLRTWLDAEHQDLHAALTGYAGGYRLIAFCAAGGDSRGCHVPEVFLQRAAIIRSRLHS